MDKFIERVAKGKSLCQRKPVYGVGINDANYVIKYRVEGKEVRCPYYRRWVNVLMRCYDPIYHVKYPTYVSCRVCDEWLTFSNFRKWMEDQDWEGKVLDKDLLVKGNKIYSPDTCIFITNDINLLIATKGVRGGTPIGVSWNSTLGKYTAQCHSFEGVTKGLGSFTNVNEAELAYCTFKADVFLQHANAQSDVRVKNALARKSNSMLERTSVLKQALEPQ